MLEFEKEIERRISCLSQRIDAAYEEAFRFPPEMGYEEGQLEAYEESLKLYRRNEDMKPDIKVYVASNEGLPWSAGEIGFPTFPMPTMKEGGSRQVGDYYATHDDRVVPILVERKSLQDAYGSFIIEKNRARLYAEIERYWKDTRFNEFVIIVEATRAQFMAYYPWAAVAWHKARGSLKRFFGATKKKKATVLEHLEERGAEIIFADDRRGAASVLSALIAAHVDCEERGIHYLPEVPDPPEVL